VDEMMNDDQELLKFYNDFGTMFYGPGDKITEPTRFKSKQIRLKKKKKRKAKKKSRRR
jgi:hypothetical protein